MCLESNRLSLPADRTKGPSRTCEHTQQQRLRCKQGKLQPPWGRAKRDWVRAVLGTICGFHHHIWFKTTEARTRGTLDSRGTSSCWLTNGPGAEAAEGGCDKWIDTNWQSLKRTKGRGRGKRVKAVRNLEFGCFYQPGRGTDSVWKWISRLQAHLFETCFWGNHCRKTGMAGWEMQPRIILSLGRGAHVMKKSTFWWPVWHILEHFHYDEHMGGSTDFIPQVNANV